MRTVLIYMYICLIQRTSFANLLDCFYTPLATDLTPALHFGNAYLLFFSTGTMISNVDLSLPLLLTVKHHNAGLRKNWSLKYRFWQWVKS